WGKSLLGSEKVKKPVWGSSRVGVGWALPGTLQQDQFPLLPDRMQGCDPGGDQRILPGSAPIGSSERRLQGLSIRGFHYHSKSVIGLRCLLLHQPMIDQPNKWSCHGHGASSVRRTLTEGEEQIF
ncbi:mCG122573, partial [Mus musculus]